MDECGRCGWLINQLICVGVSVRDRRANRKQTSSQGKALVGPPAGGSAIRQREKSQATGHGMQQRKTRTARAEAGGAHGVACGAPQPNPSNQHELKAVLFLELDAWNNKTRRPTRPHHRRDGALTPSPASPGGVLWFFVILSLGLVATGWLGTLHDVRRHSWVWGPRMNGRVQATEQ